MAQGKQPLDGAQGEQTDGCTATRAFLLADRGYKAKCGARGSTARDQTKANLL